MTFPAPPPRDSGPDDAWRGDLHLPDESWRGEVHADLSELAFGTSLDPVAQRECPSRGSPKLIIVYHARDPISADMVRGLLDGHRIPNIRLADSATGIFGVPRHLEIVVPADRAAEAIDLIREFIDDRAGQADGRPLEVRPSPWTRRGAIVVMALVSLVALFSTVCWLEKRPRGAEAVGGALEVDSRARS